MLPTENYLWPSTANPGLTATARSFVDIPDTARTAASRLTGLSRESFTIHIRV